MKAAAPWNLRKPPALSHVFRPPPPLFFFLFVYLPAPDGVASAHLPVNLEPPTTAVPTRQFCLCAREQASPQQSRWPRGENSFIRHCPYGSDGDVFHVVPVVSSICGRVCVPELTAQSTQTSAYEPVAQMSRRPRSPLFDSCAGGDESVGVGLKFRCRPCPRSYAW